MPFYENYVRLCNQINKSPSAVAIELKIGKPSVTRWKSGVKPRYATALKVANYFGVTVEELMGEGIKKERPAEGGTLDREAQNKLFRQLVDNTDDLGSLLEMLDTINKKMQELK